MADMIPLTDREKINFAESFLERFLAYGFGTMPKREMEILIFHLLYHQAQVFERRSNYEIANILKISESKVKGLIAEASLKYQQIEHRAALQAIARLFFEYQTARPILEGDMVQFALEDPVLRREFEHAVKERGYFVDYSFNREIVKVKAAIFLEIFVANFDDVADRFVDTVREVTKSEKEYQRIVNKSLPVGQRIEQFLERHPNKIALVTGILSIFSPL